MGGPKRERPTLESLNVQLRAVVPDCEVFMGDSTHYRVRRKGKPGSAALRLSGDGSDLMAGRMHRMFSVAERQAMLPLIKSWREAH